MAKQFSADKLTYIATCLLAAVFGLVIFHAPISVFFGQFAPPLLVKSWKEIILLALLPLFILAAWRAGKLAYFSRNLLLRFILLYALLHLLLWFVSSTSANQKLAGLAIDLRYVLFFGLVFCACSLAPSARRLFLRASGVAAVVSIGFATLQALVLPHDILKYLGYSKRTIAPYLTVDSNKAFIRINGTLRGPNPLGAYVMTVLTLVAAFGVCCQKRFMAHKKSLAVGTICLLIVLWASYSRSALLGIFISLGIVFGISLGRKIRRGHIIFVSVTVVLLVGIIFAARNSYFVQNVLVHSNPSNDQSLNSDEGHAASLTGSVKLLARQPLGGGIGSTGSASLLGPNPLIIENQYLFVAHEAGWLGLALFAAIFFIILRKLYHNRQDWLSLGVFASGVGLAVIGLIQPVFVDDTVSLVWWGLAAIALAVPILKKAAHD